MGPCEGQKGTCSVSAASCTLSPTMISLVSLYSRWYKFAPVNIVSQSLTKKPIWASLSDQKGNVALIRTPAIEFPSSKVCGYMELLKSKVSCCQLIARITPTRTSSQHEELSLLLEALQLRSDIPQLHRRALLLGQSLGLWNE